MPSVLITGCSSGFGEAIARRFAAAGWAVLATLRDPAAAPEFPAGVRIARLDVEEPGSIRAAVDEAIEVFGGLDCVVNGVVSGLHGAAEAAPQNRLRRRFAVDVFGPMEVVRTVLPHVRARRAGTVVNVVSGAGRAGLRSLSLDVAARFAVAGWSETLLHELSPFGIKVKLIGPGGATMAGYGLRAAPDQHGVPRIADDAPVTDAVREVFARIAASRDRVAVEAAAEATLAAAIAEDGRESSVMTEGVEPWARTWRETSENACMALMRKDLGLDSQFD